MTINRREFMLSTAVGSLASIAWPAFAAINPKLAGVLNEISNQVIAASPETSSYLGLDSGANAGARGRLDDRSSAGRATTSADIPRYQRMLASVDRTTLTGHDKLLYESVAYELAIGAAGAVFP